MPTPPLPVMFPVCDLVAYDDLDAVGDEGWDVERLLADVRVHGIRESLEVAHSADHLARGEATVFVFNGVHRLTVARMLGIERVPVVPFTRNEDAVWVEELFG